MTRADITYRKRRKASRAAQGRQRLILLIGGFALLYAIIVAKLTLYGLAEIPAASEWSRPPVIASRPDILDRNGQILATDVKLMSLYAEPRRIVDIDEAVEKIASVITDLDWTSTHRKLSSKTGFQWIRRQLTPKQQAEILKLGIPGIGFRPEQRRFYPAGSTAAHVVGHVNIDNEGLAGIERYIDNSGLKALRSTGLTSTVPLEPIRLSIDLRVQSIVHDVVANAMRDFQAESAGAILLDSETGEVLAMVSMPDYDPNQPTRLLADGSPDKEYEKGWFNSISNSSVELGSTIKSFTMAMGIDAGLVGLDTMIDASRPLRIGGFTIKDFHGRGRPLSVREVFRYSSNIGTARIADMVGIEGHRDFFSKIGLLDRVKTELPEVAWPVQPRVWKKINSITISYGHGFATTPLQAAVSAAALMNGGVYRRPTFLAQDGNVDGEQVIRAETSSALRELFVMNGTSGSGRNAQVPGFLVGGKTGTAEKVINGKYAKNINFNDYLGAFPMWKPRYVILSTVDAPKTGERGGRLAAYTAAPIVRDIIRRAAPLLGVQPRFGTGEGKSLVNF